MLIHPYLDPLIGQFEANRNPANAVRMKKYMKDQFEYYGISTPDRRSLMRAHQKEHGLPLWSDIEDITRSLWEMDERECQYIALDLLNRLKKNLSPENLPMLKYLITTKSWWDTVDGVAGWLVGALFEKHEELIPPATGKWMDSGNIWLQRTCLLFQLKYKKNTDLNLLFGFIEALADHKSFWIRKAIGWILREYSKTDPNTVKNYIGSHPELSGLSKREALKVINRT
ncbi:DNA alkylation repair protein [Bacteroidota bacterium]